MQRPVARPVGRTALRGVIRRQYGGLTLPRQGLLLHAKSYDPAAKVFTDRKGESSRTVQLRRYGVLSAQTDIVSLGNILSLPDGSEDITFWYQKTGSDVAWSRLFYIGGGVDGNLFSVGRENLLARIAIRLDSSAGLNQNVTTPADVSLFDGFPHKVRITLSGTTGRCYIDDVLVTEKTDFQRGTGLTARGCYLGGYQSAIKYSCPGRYYAASVNGSRYEFPTQTGATSAVWFDVSGLGRTATATVADVAAHCGSSATVGSDWVNQQGYSAGGLGPELVTNGDNESSVFSTTAATLLTNVSLTSSFNFAQSGASSAKITATTSTTILHSVMLMGLNTIGADVSIALSGYVFIPSSLATTGFKVYDNNDGSVITNITNVRNTWVPFSFTRPAKGSAWTLTVGNNDAENWALGSIYLDNISIRQSYPTTALIPALQPNPALDALGNATQYPGRAKYSVVPKQSICSTWALGTGIAMTGITGATILSKEGTAAVTIGTNVISYSSAGTLYNLKITLVGGKVLTIPFSESAGTTVHGYDSDGTTYQGTITAADINAFWSGRQDTYFHGVEHGYGDIGGVIQVPGNPYTPGYACNGIPLATPAPVIFQFGLTAVSSFAFTLRTTSDNPVVVDWGDGTKTIHSGVTDQTASRTYAASGNYQVRVYGADESVLTTFSSSSNGMSGPLVMNSGMTYFVCGGSNTLSGVLSLPAGMTYFVCGGSNTLSGYIPSAKANNQNRFNLAGNNTMSATNVDNILIDYAAAGGTWTGEKAFFLQGSAANRTAASNAAYATLQTKGLTTLSVD